MSRGPLCRGRPLRDHGPRYQAETQASQLGGFQQKQGTCPAHPPPAEAPSPGRVVFTHSLSLIKQIIGGHRMTNSLRASDSPCALSSSSAPACGAGRDFWGGPVPESGVRPRRGKSWSVLEFSGTQEGLSAQSHAQSPPKYGRHVGVGLAPWAPSPCWYSLGWQRGGERGGSGHLAHPEPP